MISKVTITKIDTVQIVRAEAVQNVAPLRYLILMPVPVVPALRYGPFDMRFPRYGPPSLRLFGPTRETGRSEYAAHSADVSRSALLRGLLRTDALRYGPSSVLRTEGFSNSVREF